VIRNLFIVGERPKYPGKECPPFLKIGEDDVVNALAARKESNRIFPEFVLNSTQAPPALRRRRVVQRRR
jgi:hypothetical protein